MPPNLLQKLWCHAKAISRVFAAAKAIDISFFALFFADADSIFGNRQDQDKYETFLLLSKVPALVPYLAETFLLSSSIFMANDKAPPGIRFPLVVKPIWGEQSLGVVGIRDEDTWRRFLRKRSRPYIVQQFISDALEIGVSFTRNPAGPPDFFGVAAKHPVVLEGEWRGGFYKVPKAFYHQDITHSVDRERLLELCRKIAVTLRTNTFRFDAFVRSEGTNLKLDTMQIIDVNTGVFAADEFLFDAGHAPHFFVEQLARRYTYLLVWGGQNTPFPTRSQKRKLLMHYLSCYAVQLYRHFMETAIMEKLRGFVENLAAIYYLNRRSNPRE
jgi:hypothetical protein